MQPSAKRITEQVAAHLVSDVDPEQLASFRFASPILTVSRFIHVLFSGDDLEICLKLMLLHELARVGGRFTIEQVRVNASYLEPERVEQLFRSLQRGGWFDLRGVDNTYTLSLAGINLLSLLSAADLDNLNPTNSLERAARNADFSASLLAGSATAGALSFLLDNLCALLDDQAQSAAMILQKGRPFQMIAWSRQEHTRQIQTIQGILDKIQTNLDDTSREFSRIVRIHEAMQKLVRMHSSINARLREWNLERLHTAGAGYSVAQLAEAVIGSDERTLISAVAEDIMQAPILPPGLLVDELKVRFHGARRKLRGDREAYTYTAPPPNPEEPWSVRTLDATATLRAHLTDVFSTRSASDAPVELGSWLTGTTFNSIVWEILVLSLLEGEPSSRPLIRLGDGRRVRVQVPNSSIGTALPAELLSHMRDAGVLIHLPAGWFSKIQLSLVDDPKEVGTQANDYLSY